LPCLNEETTIGQVIENFRIALPESNVYVYDNGSTDLTSEIASQKGAKVIFESSRGKGIVLRRMLAEIDADVYVIADGDATYDPFESPVLIKRLLEDKLDMVVGARSSITGRTGHNVGNKAFNFLYRWLFGSGFTDIFSGYRVLSRRYVQSFPAATKGFEIETEMSVHASQLRLPVAELPVTYHNRPEGSTSKLKTLPDGLRLLLQMFSLLKNNRPLAFFGFLGLTIGVVSLILGLPVVFDYVETGLVEKLPTALAATGLSLVSVLLLSLGALLDAVAKARIEVKRLIYLNS